MISAQIESDRLKLQMGLSPEVEIDTLTLRAMWNRLCAEQATGESASDDDDIVLFLHLIINHKVWLRV